MKACFIVEVEERDTQRTLTCTKTFCSRSRLSLAEESVDSLSVWRVVPSSAGLSYSGRSKKMYKHFTNVEGSEAAVIT